MPAQKNIPAKLPAAEEQFQTFVKQWALNLRKDDKPPKTLAEWKHQKTQLRENLAQSWGTVEETPCPLEPKKMGELKRDGYTVEKIVLQTIPGIQMTANAYVPNGPGKKPAVLCVHGHFRGAKQDPVIQARCIGLAKLGFFVLAVDAFGAGERGLGKALGEYHGEMVGATLFPAGLTLSGIQVYENMRAVDYLQSRPDVDSENIGITGASGGGNQTMYAGAFDERLKCVVPTCSVGNYQAYLSAACCMCEVVPDALTYTEEWGLLAMVAPRALMINSATKDAFQFSVAESKKSLNAAQPVFNLYGKPNNLKHLIFVSTHAYNQPMREAMYGWMILHLKGQGVGDPIPEPKHTTEAPETLRCFPGESRPNDFVTLPQFAARKAAAITKKIAKPKLVEQWDQKLLSMLKSLTGGTLGTIPERSELNLKQSVNKTETGRLLTFESEPGMTVSAEAHFLPHFPQKLAVIIDLDGRDAAEKNPLTAELGKAGWSIVTADLRGTGVTAYKRDKVGRAPDHNSAEWSMWIGRPLLGQWVWDLVRLLDSLEAADIQLPEDLAIIGIGSAGIVSLCHAGLDARVSSVATVDSLNSFTSPTPYENQRLGCIIPGILKDVGDVPQLASIMAPKKLVIAGSVAGNGEKLTLKEMKESFTYTRHIYDLENSGQNLKLFAEGGAGKLVNFLNPAD